jgi:hypothetical protein
MNEDKILEIKEIINDNWGGDKYEICRNIEYGFIFGEYGENEHYLLSDIMSIYEEVELEKNPIDKTP